MEEQPVSLNPSQAGALSNIRILAHACQLAYCAEPLGAEQFQRELGMRAQLISIDNTQVYVAEGLQSLVVAFRGSESLTILDGFKDWLLTNAMNLLVLPDGRIGTDFAAAGVGARFHRGFMLALAEIWDPLFSAVQEAWDRQERPLWITGHSLGGALALLAAWRLQQAFLPVHEVVTFGAPMVGNAAAARAFEREFPGKIFRYIDVDDVVPLLPMISLVANDYASCQQEVRLQSREVRPVTDLVQQLASVAVQAAMTATLADEIWKLLHQRIAAHLLPNYRQLLMA
jgi:hypothetical protein